MAEGKYTKYVNEPGRRMLIRLDVEKLRRYIMPVPLMMFDKTVVAETPIWFEFYIVYGPGPGPGTGEHIVKGAEPFKLIAPDGTLKEVKDLPHKHLAEEIFCFLPTDPHNVDDLGGEVEYWLGEGEEAEKFIITKPTVVFVPKNTVHCPIVFRKVYRPFIVMIIFNSPDQINPSVVDVLPPGFKL